MEQGAPSSEDVFANRPDYEFIKAFQRQLLELRQQFITLLGKTVFSPDEIEALTTLVAPILWTMKNNLPKEEAIEKFWTYWKEPQKFVREYPQDYTYIIYFKRSGEVRMIPAKDEDELSKKERELRLKQYNILNVRIVPTPDLLKRIVEIILKTASEAGLISIKMPLMNRPILFSEKEAEREIKKLNKSIMGW